MQICLDVAACYNMMSFALEKKKKRLCNFDIIGMNWPISSEITHAGWSWQMDYDGDEVRDTHAMYQRFVATKKKKISKAKIEYEKQIKTFSH